MVLNFLVDVNFFLCLEKPIVIKTIPNIPTKGCSTANCLAKDVNPPIPFSLIRGVIQNTIPDLLVIVCVRLLMQIEIFLNRWHEILFLEKT